MDRNSWIGWILFTVSAVFFTATSLRSGDMVGLAGSLLFLVACFFFMIPTRKAAKDRAS